MKATWELALLCNMNEHMFEAMNYLDEAASLADEVEAEMNAKIAPQIGNMADFKANIQYQLGLAAKSLQDLVQAVDYFKAAIRCLGPPDQVNPF